MNFSYDLNLINPFKFLKEEPSSYSSSSSTYTSSSPSINFVSINLNCYKNHLKSSYERIREIDSLRLHFPSITERFNLRLPGIFEHIDMLNINSFLLLCGGNNGIQFTIEVTKKEKLTLEIDIFLFFLFFLFLSFLFYHSISSP